MYTIRKVRLINLGREQHIKMIKRITQEQKAYVAGFIEGEGSFVLAKSRAHDPRISTGQKNKAPLVYIQGLFGGTIHYRPKTNAYLHRLLKSEDLITTVKSIYPYLISSRAKRRAWCIYKMAKLLGKRGIKHRISSSEQEQREEIYRVWNSTRRPVKGRLLNGNQH